MLGRLTITRDKVEENCNYNVPIKSIDFDVSHISINKYHLSSLYYILVQSAFRFDHLHKDTGGHVERQVPRQVTTFRERNDLAGYTLITYVKFWRAINLFMFRGECMVNLNNLLSKTFHPCFDLGQTHVEASGIRSI